MGTRTGPTAKPRPAAASADCAPPAASSPKAEPPESRMASTGCHATGKALILRMAHGNAGNIGEVIVHLKTLHAIVGGTCLFLNLFSAMSGS
jgi:hypothetical protein